MRLLALAVLLAGAAAANAQYGESITVARILIDVRVTALDGEPITGLAAGDFTVTIGGKRAEVESVTWVDDVTPRAETPSAAPAPRGRLLVMLVQTDFARHPTRTRGQLNFLRYADAMVGELAKEDRVAVLQFDSHLKFRLDFTSDKSAVRAALQQTILIDRPPPPPPVEAPSLASALDPERMRRAASPETALLLIANALRTIDGPKTLLLLGWGLGVRNPSGVRMRSSYIHARRSLEAARTSIFALDTTHADYHDLELGLRTAAEDTGGFYAKTHLFPQIAVDRLQRTLAGHYELELRRPRGLVPGTHDLDVRVKRRRVMVLAPTSWMDRP